MITEEELLEKAKDLSVSDEELAKYFITDPERGGAFQPAVIPNPQEVKASPLEGAFLLNRFNGISRWRRKKKYKKRVKNWTGTRIVSEGDSWFQYPFKLKDVIDQLCDLDQYHYAIYSLGEAGDLLSNIFREDEITEAVRNENPHILLISGGGNDMVGDSRIARMVHPHKQGRSANEYPNELFEQFLDELESFYRRLFDRVLRERPHIKIVCHGYDHALPDKGRWLGKPLSKVGIKTASVQKNIVKVMIDRFNERLLTIAADYPGSVFHTDCRTLVGTRWADELHPNNTGFKRVAAVFDSVIQQALSETSAAVAVPADAASVIRGHEEITTIGHVNQLGEQEFEQLVFERAKSTIGKGVKPPRNPEERRQLEQEIEKYFEKVHKGEDFLPTSFLELGVRRAQAVCRIVTQSSYGSGFLVASRNFIMTNNHVLPNAAEARNSTAQFDYDEDDVHYAVSLDPDRLFITSTELDFTIVACIPDSLPEDILPIPLLSDPATITRHERVNIIQHPRGRPQEISLHDNKVSYVYDRLVQYTADTEPGSSGSPVFNNQWELVGLHHAGWADGEGGATNEGVRISAIVEYLFQGQHDDRERDQILLLAPLVKAITTSGGGQLVANSVGGKKGAGGHGLTINLDGPISEVNIRVR